MKVSVKTNQKGVGRTSRPHDAMEFEQIVNDTQDISTRIHAPKVLGPWEPCALVADIAGEAGTLARSILTIEGIAAAPPETAHLTTDIPRLLYMLVDLSNFYHIDLEQAWNDLMREGRANLARLENRETDGSASG